MLDDMDDVFISVIILPCGNPRSSQHKLTFIRERSVSV
jgi:hypothetical protein